MVQKKDYQKTIGINISRIRKAYDYSINDFAKLLGISEPFLRQIEKGQKGLSLYNIIMLLNTFKIKFEDLIDEKLTETDISLADKLSALNARLTCDEKETLISLLMAYLNKTCQS